MRRAVNQALDERETGRSESVELGYGRWWARLKGVNVFGVVLIAAVLVGGFFVLGQKLDAHNSEMRASEEKSSRALQESNELQQAMVYVLWRCRGKPDPECEALNLARPKKLTEMMRER